MRAKTLRRKKRFIWQVLDGFIKNYGVNTPTMMKLSLEDYDEVPQYQFYYSYRHTDSHGRVVLNIAQAIIAHVTKSTITLKIS